MTAKRVFTWLSLLLLREQNFLVGVLLRRGAAAFVPATSTTDSRHSLEYSFYVAADIVSCGTNSKITNHTMPSPECCGNTSGVAFLTAM